MSIFKRTATALMSSLFIGTACIPVRAAATSETQAPLTSNVMLANNAVAASLPAARSWLEPSPVDVAIRKDRASCKAGQLYSQDDIVGDPQACIINRLTIGAGVAP
jgi:hypothetical protein